MILVAREAATYAWIIDVDHISGDCSDVGVSGPSTAPDDLLRILNASLASGYLFRMLDDDGEHYYTGRILGGGPDADEHAAFGPLWDFGTPNAGCTDIQYQDERGQWVSL